MQIQQTEKRRNILFVSSTGNGKSSTCNQLLGEEYFVTSDLLNSCTSAAADKIIPRLNLRVIDTAGFGDTNFNQSKIDQILNDVTIRMIDIDDSGTNKIDAIVLVCKCTPRASTLKNDIERIRNIFGTVALKSLVILIIMCDPYYDMPDDKVMKAIKESMPEITNLLCEAKGQPFNQKWFIRWDNLRPRPNQEKNFMDAIQGIQGYTHQKFLDAKKEINDRLDKNINKKIEEGKKQIEKDFANDKKKMEAEIAKMTANFEQQRRQMKKSAEEAALNCENLLTLLKELNEGNNTRFKEMMAEAQKQSRQQQELMMQQIERNNSTYIAMFQKQNEQFNKQQAHIMKLILGMANRPVIVEGGGGECTLI